MSVSDSVTVVEVIDASAVYVLPWVMVFSALPIGSGSPRPTNPIPSTHATPASAAFEALQRAKCVGLADGGVCGVLSSKKTLSPNSPS